MGSKVASDSLIHPKEWRDDEITCHCLLTLDLIAFRKGLKEIIILIRRRWKHVASHLWERVRCEKGFFSCVLFSEKLVIFNGCFIKGGCDHDASKRVMGATFHLEFCYQQNCKDGSEMSTWRKKRKEKIWGY